MSLTVDRIRELVQGRALPGSLACVQGTCESTHGGTDHCSCKLILAELGIANVKSTPAARKIAQSALDPTDA